MAKMYGDRGRECWDSPDHYTKSMIKAREERQWRKEAEAEELVPGECPHVTSVREDIAGLKACHECWCFQRGLDPYTTPDYRIDEING
jgi:hypothetical protein